MCSEFDLAFEVLPEKTIHEERLENELFPYDATDPWDAEWCEWCSRQREGSTMIPHHILYKWWQEGRIDEHNEW